MEGLAFKFDWFKEVLGGCDVATPCFVVASSLEALTLSKEAFGVAESFFPRPDMAASVLSLWLDVDILGVIEAEERKELDPKGEYWLLPDLGNDWYE